jgi:cobalt-zinc-cadmium efflux system outer membrane protein
LAAAAPGLPTQAQEPSRWTLAEAQDKAFSQSPRLRARQTEVAEVASGLVGARTYPHNPELTLEAADRRGPGGATTDRGFSLSQELEIAGQRGKRLAVASERLAAAEATLQRDLRLLAFRVETAFAEAVRDRELLSVAETDAALAREVLDFSKLRLERGAATQIEVNLAQASAGRSERNVQRTRAAYASARSRLAEVAGVDPAVQPEPDGELPFPRGDLPSLETLLATALANRGDFAAIQRQEQAAEAAIRLAAAEGKPNLILGAFVQREEGTDDITGATVGVSLPLFNRNQGPIAESRAVRERLRHEHQALRLAIEQEVLAAVNELRAAQASAEFLRDQVLGTLEENVQLLQRSFAAGRIGATEVVTLRREFVASRQEYIEVLADAWLARIDLDLASGRLALPQISTGKGTP